jgi:beta-N-acetylhexosaminidase
MPRFLRIFQWLLIITLLLSMASRVTAQDGGEEAFIAGLLPRMSPEARVGQLFVVSFNGTGASPNSDVADLILNYRVGGVSLSAAQGNFSDAGPLQITNLTSALQNLSRQTTRGATPSPFVPLFVAVEQDGDGAPNSQITTGLTPAPSYMAMGATWDQAAAEAAGQAVGQELAALGVNFLIGPMLDVRRQPSTSAFDPGVNVFGGDPYWVGALAQAYVRGLRAGSGDRLAAILKHFPGEGGLDDDSYTIDQSLEDLKKFDLSPFFKLMTLQANKARPLADAVLTTNARYRGFAGNIRERTRPVSVDGDVLQQLIALPEVKAWRDAGGLIVGDALASTSVHNYYATTASGAISVTQAALDAFQAGHDVLIIRGLSDDPAEEARLTREIIQSFRQRYSTDPAFQGRVDGAVQRILRLKYRLYPNFDPAKVVVPVDTVRTNVGKAITTTQQIADEALTLLWPSPVNLTAARPTATDTFFIATDDRTYKECSSCAPRTTLRSDDLARAITQQYGVPSANITSTTFSGLKAFVLNVPSAPDLLPSIQGANWIVFVMQSIDPNVPASDAVRQLIALRPDLLTGKRVIGLLMGPPQGLTANELARFTALYVIYGKTSPFIDAAARALSGERMPPGRSPVNLSVLNYDLTRQTEPDPGQVIQLAIGDEAVEGQPTPPPLNLRVGDSVKVRTGLILDRNGHPVPDDTPVRFNFQYPDTAATTVQNGKTQNGVARTEFVLQRVGQLIIRAASDPALNSIAVQITINDAGVFTVATLAPPPTITPTPPPTITPTPSATPTITPTPTPSFLQTLLVEKPQRAHWTELLLALIGVGLAGSGGYWRMHLTAGDRSRALRAALWSAIGGLIAYTLFGLGLPGASALRSVFGAWAALLVTLIGGLIPLVWWWRKA